MKYTLATSLSSSNYYPAAAVRGRYGEPRGTPTQTSDDRGPARTGAGTAPPPDPVGRTGPRRLDVTV